MMFKQTAVIDGGGGGGGGVRGSDDDGGRETERGACDDLTTSAAAVPVAASGHGRARPRQAAGVVGVVALGIGGSLGLLHHQVQRREE